MDHTEQTVESPERIKKMTQDTFTLKASTRLGVSGKNPKNVSPSFSLPFTQSAHERGAKAIDQTGC